MTKTIDITPKGLMTPEGNQRVAKAMKAFEDATSVVAIKATDFIRDHEAALLNAVTGEPLGKHERAELREDYWNMKTAIGARETAQEELLRAVAGHPEQRQLSEMLGAMGRIGMEQPELTELVHAEADPEGPWALYIFSPDGMHSGKQWFDRVVEYPGEQITVAEAKARAEAAIAQGLEVRVCDGGDRLVFHSISGQSVHAVHGEGFWEAIGG